MSKDRTVNRSRLIIPSFVFVHGFTGHPERTWTHKHGDGRQVQDNDGTDENTESPRKSRKLNIFSRASASTSVYWPRDLLPATIPNARVLTYGYDTNIRHRFGRPVNQSTVIDFAWDFLIALESERDTCQKRPILFIAHSLGGIVVKEMLRKSSGCQAARAHLQSISSSTKGIIFFGTPHGGSDPRTFLHSVAEKVIKLVGFSVNEQIVSTLLPSSERLRELRDEFGPMAAHNKWIIHSFQEQLGIAPLNGRKVVDDTSSYLNLPEVETPEHIGCNHMEMCRFSGHDDTEYKKVAAALRRILGRPTEMLPIVESFMPTKDQKQSLLDSLRFDQIDARLLTIKRAHAKTCKWLLKNSEYLHWLDDEKMQHHRGFLWLKGNPGTGKSTLMKYAVSQARRVMPNTMVLSFFFNARGEILEKSTTGLYRSLLLQLLEKVPALDDSLGSVGFTAAMMKTAHNWNDETLKDIFLQCVQSLESRSIVCFIDALDECDEKQIRDMITFFENMVDGSQFNTESRLRVFFASRYYPYITMSNGLELKLEGQEGHNQDITNYLDTELRIGHSKMAEQIRGELQEKASGIFIWVALVVEMLNKEFDNGRMHVLRQRLRSIPKDLYELFEDILTRDSENKEELLLCIQWILFARQPLTPEQLYFAVLSGIVEPQALTSLHDDEDPNEKDDAARKFVLSSSKGLAQVTRSKVPTVQFIHESVRDFLLKENGFKKIWPDTKGTLAGQSHDNMKRCCMSYLDIDIPTTIESSSTESRLALLNKFPLLEYAVNNVLHHSNAAHGNGLSQESFLREFAPKTWIKLQNKVEKFVVRRHQHDVSLLYLLAEKDLSHLIDIYPEKRKYLSLRGGRYGYPLVAAVANRSYNAIKSFVAAEAEYEAQQDSGNDAFSKILESYSFSGGESFSTPGLDMEYRLGKPLFDQLGHYCGHSMLEFLYAIGAITSHCQTSSRLTPLHVAANARQLESASLEVAKSLLWNCPTRPEQTSHIRDPSLRCCSRLGLDLVNHATLPIWSSVDIAIYTENPNHGTPLTLAVMRNDPAMVSMLIDTAGIHPLFDINERERENASKLLVEVSLLRNYPTYLERDCSLLSMASEKDPAIYQSLLESGVDLDVRCSSHGWTLLHHTVRFGNEAQAARLLDAGASVEKKTLKGRSALSLSAECCNLPLARLLIERGAKVDSSGDDGWTPLFIATQQKHTEMVKFLLDSRSRSQIAMQSWETRLLVSVIAGDTDIVKALLELGANPDCADLEGRTPLSYAAESGNYNITAALLDKGATIDHVDNSLRTPIAYAARTGNTMVVRALLGKGARPDFASLNGLTPLSYAVEAGKGEIVAILLEAWSNLSGFTGDTELTPSVHTDHKEQRVSIDRLLAAHGIDVNFRYANGDTLLHLAVRERCQKVVASLLKH